MDITAVVLLLVGVIFILVTLSNILIRTIKRKRCTETAQGIITEVVERDRRNNGVRTREYIARVRYEAEGGVYETKLAKAYTSSYQTGQVVDVLYNPNRPQEINKKGTSNKADLILCGIGLLIALAGALVVALG